MQLLALFVFWYIGGIYVMNALKPLIAFRNIWWYLSYLKYLWIVIVFALLVMISAMLRTSFKQLRIIISLTGTVIIEEYELFGSEKAKDYELAQITNFRWEQSDSIHGKILFDYGGQTIQCGKYLNFEEADKVTEYLKGILTFRCHVIERVIFGSVQDKRDDMEITLYNPDVSDLTFPCVWLQKIIIDAATYDFHLVERFLTYAVNYIGQEHLKKHVEVHIYGDPEKLHLNLRNSLTNLCRRVDVCYLES